MRRTCTVLKCPAGETPLCVLLLGCSVVKNNKGCSVLSEAAFQSQGALYRVRREARPRPGGLSSVIRAGSAPLCSQDQVYKKHMWALSAPKHEQRACRDWLL